MFLIQLELFKTLVILPELKKFIVCYFTVTGPSAYFIHRRYTQQRDLRIYLHYRHFSFFVAQIVSHVIAQRMKFGRRDLAALVAVVLVENPPGERWRF